MEASQIGKKTYRWDSERKRLVITSGAGQEEVSAQDAMQLLTFLDHHSSSINEAARLERGWWEVQPARPRYQITEESEAKSE